MVTGRRAAGALALAVATALLVVLVARTGSGLGEATAREASFGRDVSTDIQPRAHGFGETITAHLRLVVRTDQLVRGSLRARGSFDPYEVVGRPRLTFTDAGEFTIAHYALRIRCVSVACLPQGATKEFEFETPDERGGSQRGVSLVWKVPAPPGRRARDARLDERRVSATWPTVTVVRGISESDLDETRWRSSLGALPALSPRTRAGRLEAILLLLAAVLVVAAAALVAFWWRRLERKPADVGEAHEPPSQLEQALQLVETVDGDLSQRRAALETLAVALRHASEPELASQAERLAWDLDPPRGDAVSQLAASVRHRVDGGRT